MTDTPFTAELKRRREDLTAQIAALQEQRKAIDTLLASEAPVMATMPDRVPDPVADEIPPAPIVTRRKSKAERTRARYAILEACRRAITDAGRPIARKEMFERVDLASFEIPTDDPRNYVSALIWKAPHLIVHFRDHGYWVAEKPYEPLGYTGDPAAPNIHIARKGPVLSRLGRLQTEHLEPPLEDGPPLEQGGNPDHD